MILLADDDQDFRFLCSRVLKRNGYAVTPAADAISAIDLLTRQTFALVISDVNMPGNDGLRLARVTCQLTTIPVILFSSEFTSEIKRLGARIGVLACIQKTADFDLLLISVADMVETQATTDLAIR